jgi:LmbE family N-acetylglucosaminyl deacetylase
LATEPFDTSIPGAPESEWAAWASTAPVWIPSEGPVVVVAPHPDDETLGAGGLIAACMASRRSVTLISITDGEAACPEIQDLAAVRRGELVGAMRELQLAPADMICLRMPDGGLVEHEVELTQSLTERIPAGATLVAPFEFDGHPDHDAAGRACRAATLRCGAALARYPIWAWHRGGTELLSERRVVRFMLSTGAERAKRRALAHFRSQLMDRDGGAIVPPHVLAYFKRPYEVFLL